MFPIIVFLLPFLFPLLHASTTPPPVQLPSTGPPTSILIRRRIPALSRSTGGRYSLLNNRVNRRPKKKNLDPSQLMDLLGRFFDPRWMSVDDPGKSAGYSAPGEGWQQADLQKQILAMNLSRELEAPKDVARTMEKWFLKKATCPVRYTWEDIGPLFWPRFVRLGACPPVQGSCSWPPGMHCVPASTNNLHVLRWQCKAPRTTQHRKKAIKGDQPTGRCSWIVVPYPVTNGCMCTC